MAQGAALAFEDALALADRLSSEASIDQALGEFVRERHTRTTWVRKQTHTRPHAWSPEPHPQSCHAPRWQANVPRQLPSAGRAGDATSLTLVARLQAAGVCALDCQRLAAFLRRSDSLRTCPRPSGLGPSVRRGLAHALERWDGHGSRRGSLNPPLA
jgi:hypothetical protein